MVCVWGGWHHKLGYQATSENVCPTAVLSMRGTQKEWEWREGVSQSHMLMRFQEGLEQAALMSTVKGQARGRWCVRGQFPAENKQGRQGSDTDLDLGAGHMDLLVTFVKTHWTVHLCLVWTLSGYRSHFNEKLKDGFLILKNAYIVKGNIPKQVCFPFKQAAIKNTLRKYVSKTNMTQSLP